MFRVCAAVTTNTWPYLLGAILVQGILFGKPSSRRLLRTRNRGSFPPHLRCLSEILLPRLQNLEREALRLDWRPQYRCSLPRRPVHDSPVREIPQDQMAILCGIRMVALHRRPCWRRVLKDTGRPGMDARYYLRSWTVHHGRNRPSDPQHLVCQTSRNSIRFSIWNCRRYRLRLYCVGRLASVIFQSPRSTSHFRLHPLRPQWPYNLPDKVEALGQLYNTCRRP
jgi:hypothetical protein